MRKDTILAKGSFDPARVGFVNKGLKAIRAPMFGEKWGEKGIVGTRERQAAEALKAAREMGFKSVTETRAAAEKTIRENQKVDRTALDRSEAEHKRDKDNAESRRAGV